MKKVDEKKVKKIMLGRIETSPLKSSSVGDSEACRIDTTQKDYASLKTFKSEGAPSIYYTREMRDLLSAYVQVNKMCILILITVPNIYNCTKSMYNCTKLQ